MQALSMYTAGMKQRQYTVRGVPPLIDKELRKKARLSRRSLNEVTLETLRTGLGINKKDILQSKPDLAGLAVFDHAPKRPSRLDQNKPIKELYRESMTKK